ncbi:MAG: hypothetical protein IPP93_17405 [Chitinophagaceae bacterium]|nr:hypothetical protein [Chitinophagaceae bacterium]
MADNTDEKQSDVSANSEPDKPADNISPAKEPETNTPNQEAENMEVHHHGHHGGKKSWKSYFWEFLMLFLAVFCGFLAEYQLEHTIEHQREEKYIVSLVKDIELDIASLENSYDLRKVQLSYFDSLSGLLKRGYKNQMNDFYFYARHISRSTLFRYHDRTILQLKNSGNLRLIRNTDAADSITVYDNEAIKTVLVQQDTEEDFRQNIAWTIIGKIMDGAVWDEMNDSNSKISRPVNNPPLVTTDPNLINEFHFKVVQLKATLLFTNRYIQKAILSARNLLVVLKREYHLK